MRCIALPKPEWCVRLQCSTKSFTLYRHPLMSVLSFVTPPLDGSRLTFYFPQIFDQILGRAYWFNLLTVFMIFFFFFSFGNLPHSFAFQIWARWSGMAPWWRRWREGETARQGLLRARWAPPRRASTAARLKKVARLKDELSEQKHCLAAKMNPVSLRCLTFVVEQQPLENWIMFCEMNLELKLWLLSKTFNNRIVFKF